MNDKHMTPFNHGLIWFGAAISIAEILTGALLAPLGFKKALLAIVLGHLIGGGLMYLAGLIGARTQRSAMETVKMSFGEKGGLLFASLNIMQLVGWTAVMIAAGAAAANSIFPTDSATWAVGLGVLIIIWIFVGIGNIAKLSLVTMAALFALSLLMSKIIFASGSVQTLATGGMSFGSAVELSVIMPLSWLPLISDYTRSATHKPRLVTFTGVAVYFFASCWMYAIGVAAAIYTGKSDVAEIMTAAGFGIAAVLVVVASTVTTTFLDVYSAGVSAVSLTKRLNEKHVAIVACLAGTALAIFTPVSKFESFLYLIGSVFAPMIAVMIVDAYILKRNHASQRFSLSGLAVWVFGFVAYRYLMHTGFETLVGLTVPVMILTAVVALVVAFITSRSGKQVA